MEQEVIEAKSFDELADAVLDKAEKEAPAGSSTEIKTEGEETKTTETPGAEPVKTEKVKEVEEDSSLSPEDKIAKIKEILGDDEKALDAYIKEKGYHNDPAWQKQRELIERLKKEKAEGGLSAEDKALLEDVKKTTSSREYVETSMKAQGYTQEAINKTLREKGFDIAEKPEDDLQLIGSKLNIDTSKLSLSQKNDIQDIVKIADVIFQDRMNKFLPGQLKPIQEHIGEMNQTASAGKVISSIRETVKAEGILDFEKDVEPELHKFLDSNPDATQEDVLRQSKEINHRLTIERLKLGKRKDEREVKKGELRQISVGAGDKNILPSKTGEFDQDADALLDTLGVS